MPISTDTSREDPLVGFNFGFEVPNLQITSYFTEVSGIGSENEVSEMKAVNDKGVEIVLKVPGRLKWGDITLKRGITTEMDIWKWRKMIEDGKVQDARQNGSVIMYDQEGIEKVRWNFENGWPSKVTGPAVKSDDNAFGIEEMTIVHEYITREEK